ncbi:D-3-phosphoglycerate dehydrogenase [Candidatus Rhodobacter oscarellae]|uniref:D-3-phosphoglycerate dehydrogenase n=1 Tax=Candidatus Rhodobacter oscarellae TaxID=1675527 RepID=A0A0J9E730_9RHOB|nr:D-3-phosphoglycerate dehydrogenase [Candidatus Rhodobacter lobularis]
MSKPVVLQVGPYPDWDHAPLDDAFDMRRYFEAGDARAFLDLDNVLLQPHHA